MQKIVFQTREGDTFRLPLKLVKYMKTIWDMVNVTSDEVMPQDPTPIVLENIRTGTFQYILHWSMYTSMTDKTQDIEENEQMKDESEDISMNSMVTDGQSLPNEMPQLDPWIKKFLGAMPLCDLYQVMAATDYLNIELLEQQTCAFLANQMKGKNTKELREFFGIRNDFSPQQKREMKENEANWEK